MEILFREFMCIGMGKHFEGGHSPKNTLLPRHVTEHVPFKVLSQ